MLAIFRISITILWPLCQGFVPFHNIFVASEPGLVPNFVAPEHFAREPSFASSSSSKKRWAAMTEDDGVRAQHCHGRNTAMALNQEKMAARDLVAELKNKRAAVTSAAAEEPMNTAQIEEMETTAVAHRELDGCWCLNVSAEYQDAAVKSGDMDMVECMQAMTGTAFFDTGNGQPLHRPTEEQMPLACSLYFFAVPTGTWTPGWCCGSHLFRSEKGKSRWDNACGLRSLCWAGGQHNVPSSFHFAKKPSKGIEAVWKSYLTQTIACREQLDESMTEADKPEDKAIVEASPSVAEEEDADQQDEEEDAEQQKGKAHGKSFSFTNDKQPKKHGGWMPRLAQLAPAYLRAAWSSKLIQRFRGESQTFAKVRDQKKASKTWSGMSLTGMNYEAAKRQLFRHLHEMAHLRLMSTVSARDSFRC